ncbi:TPA: GNAT family N-acetyltransferase [Candidatus Dependentiae bacterium]|nr:MAG: hypothetical protein A2Y17_09870 [Clostridiales bacterium GWF2_38_85]HBL98982.1 GNAT family N-acetyltransferase [Candidatus Dependentiae bacterium]
METTILLPIPIKTPRLLIRPLQPGDGKALYTAARESQDEFEEFMPWASDTTASPDAAENFAQQASINWVLKISSEPWLQLLILCRETNAILGIANFHHIEWDVPCVEIGYWLSSQKTGKGFMTETINALTRYAIEMFHARRIEIRCDITNVKSQGVPRRLGYALEATLKSNRLDHLTGEPSDTLIYVRHNAENLPPLEVSWPGKKSDS